jgi:hypothetical protein
MGRSTTEAERGAAPAPGGHIGFMEFMAGRAHRAGELIHSYLGLFDLRAQAQIASALRADTPR